MLSPTQATWVGTRCASASVETHPTSTKASTAALRTGLPSVQFRRCMAPHYAWTRCIRSHSLKPGPVSVTLRVVMARPFMALAGLLSLVASAGCSGGYGPGPETHDGGHRNWPDGDSGIHAMNLHDDVGSVCGHDGGGMWCPRSAPIEPIAGTCTYPLPCEAFVGVGTRVYADGTQLPQGGAGDSWSYDDGGLMVSINGQLCVDIMSGAPVAITFDSSCSIIP